MTEKQPAVEYDVGVMEGSLLVRRSADGVRITVQPSARRVLDAMVWGAGWWALLIGAALFVEWLISTARHGPVIFWGWNLLLVFSMVAGMASAAYSFLFPIEIELDGGQLTWSWRALTEVKRGSIPRESIKSVAVERVRAGRGPARVWGLTVQFGAYMPFVLLRGSQRELAVIAGALRERLTLSEERHMAVQIPAGCRFERTRWGDGVSILIPPRGKWIVRGAVGVALLAATPWAYLAMAKLSDDSGHPLWVVTVAQLALLAIGVVLVWLGVVNGVERVRRQVVLCANPRWVQVMETGLVRPLNVAIPLDKAKDIQVKEAGRGSIIIEMVQGPPLEVAGGENLAELRWAVAVMKAAMGR